MKRKTSSLSPAHITGFILLSFAAGVLFFHQPLAAAIALLYIIMCITASFFPQSNFYLPVISRGSTGKNQVALTFDDGPAPLTLQILDLLDKYEAKATFFVSGVNALKHPDIIGEIIARDHTVGNHSFHHNPFLMLGRYNYLHEEIFRTQGLLRIMGVQALAFRPPVGIVSPKLPWVLDKLGMFCVTFSCRAADFGNRRIKDLSVKILRRVKPDDIILLHDTPPSKDQDRALLLSEIEKILQGLKAKNLKVVPLADLTGKKIN